MFAHTDHHLTSKTGSPLILATLTTVLAVLTAWAPVFGEGSETKSKDRQFDFWVGDWDVFNKKGKKVGTNSIKKLLKGHLLYENWTAQNGTQGKSLNFYNSHSDQWRQIWVDERGGLVDAVAQFQDDAMRFTGMHYYPNGRTESFRMDFTPQKDGRVRQFVQQSKDEGKTWYTWFDGMYVRRDEPILEKEREPAEDNRSSLQKQFDFWVGDWDAVVASGTVAGRNRIAKLLKGHLILEHWTGGGEGMSFNYLHPATGKWHQNWISATGGIVRYSGELKDGKMQLTGENLPPNKPAVEARVQWTPRDSGQVHHLIEHTKDHGKT